MTENPCAWMVPARGPFVAFEVLKPDLPHKAVGVRAVIGIYDEVEEVLEGTAEFQILSTKLVQFLHRRGLTEKVPAAWDPIPWTEELSLSPQRNDVGQSVTPTEFLQHWAELFDAVNDPNTPAWGANLASLCALRQIYQEVGRELDYYAPEKILRQPLPVNGADLSLPEGYVPRAENILLDHMVEARMQANEIESPISYIRSNYRTYRELRSLHPSYLQFLRLVGDAHSLFVRFASGEHPLLSR